MLRRTIFLAATISTALIVLPFNADAQPKAQRGGGNAGRGAPAAPHVAAPRMAAPHIAAPRMAAPHIAAPRAATPQHMGFHGAPAIHRGTSSGSMTRGPQRALAPHRNAPSV